MDKTLPRPSLSSPQLIEIFFSRFSLVLKASKEHRIVEKCFKRALCGSKARARLCPWRALPLSPRSTALPQTKRLYDTFAPLRLKSSSSRIPVFDLTPPPARLAPGGFVYAHALSGATRSRCMSRWRRARRSSSLLPGRMLPRLRRWLPADSPARPSDPWRPTSLSPRAGLRPRCKTVRLVRTARAPALLHGGRPVRNRRLRFGDRGSQEAVPGARAMCGERDRCPLRAVAPRGDQARRRCCTNGVPRPPAPLVCA